MCILHTWIIPSQSRDELQWEAGPSCSKLTMSLVNDSLKLTWSDMQIC